MAVFDIIIPFIFMLAIVFGALDVSGVFKNKRVNALIALVFALFTLTYQPAIDFINQIMPIAIILFIAFFFIGFIIKMGKQGVNKDYTLIIVIASLVLLAMATQGSLISGFLPGLAEQWNNMVAAIAVVLVGVILFAAYRKGSKAKPGE
jgi:hypothetical protein